MTEPDAPMITFLPGRVSRGFVALAIAFVLAFALTAPQPAHANGWEHHAIPFKALLRALASDNPEYRMQAAISMGVRREARAVKPLLAALARPEDVAGVRRTIYEALGRIGDRRALAVLHGALAGEELEEVRGAAAAALGAIGAPESLAHLLAAFESDGLTFKSRVIDALAAYPQDDSIDLLARTALGGANASLRSRAIRALGETRAAAAGEPLLTALASARTDRARSEVVDALGRTRIPAAREPLTRLLRETDAELLRARIAVALGSIGGGDAEATLIEMLGDNSRHVQFFAIDGLNRLGSTAAAKPLTRLYLRLAAAFDRRDAQAAPSNPTPLVADLDLMRGIMRALIAGNAPAGLPAFLDAAKPREFFGPAGTRVFVDQRIYELRRVAAVGLGYTGATGARQYIVGFLLDDPDYRLRAAATRSIGVLGRPGAVEVVVAMLRDPHPEVRWTAASVLGRLADATAVRALAGRLTDSHAEVRRQAAISLGYLGANETRAALEGLANGDPRETVREAARHALDLLDDA